MFQPMSNTMAIQPRAIQQTQVFSMSEVKEKFFASMDVREQSKKVYARQFSAFASWLERRGLLLSSVGREDILEYKDYLQTQAGEHGQGLSSLSVAGYLTIVRKLFSWLESVGVMFNITRGLKSPKRGRSHKKDTLLPEQLRECLTGIEDNESLSEVDKLRDFAIFNLIARTGLRTIEVARAQVGDIRRVDGRPVLYVQGKGRDEKDEFVVLTQEALEPILAYVQARGKMRDEAPLFASSSPRNYGSSMTTRSISRLIKNAMIAAGYNDRRLTAHSLRHTAVTLAIQGGATLPQAQAMARHASPQTTMIYFHDLNRVSDSAESRISF